MYAVRYYLPTYLPSCLSINLPYYDIFRVQGRDSGKAIKESEWVSEGERESPRNGLVTAESWQRDGINLISIQYFRKKKSRDSSEVKSLVGRYLPVAARKVRYGTYRYLVFKLPSCSQERNQATVRFPLYLCTYVLSLPQIITKSHNSLFIVVLNGHEAVSF